MDVKGRGMLFKVVSCNRCSNLQLTSAESSFKCFRCGAQNSLSRRNTIFVARSQEEARRYLLQLKMSIRKGAGEHI